MYSDKLLKLHLDPRTKFVLLIIANVLLLLGTNDITMYCYMIFLAILLVLSSCFKALLKLGILFLILLVLQRIILPIAPKMFVIAFAIIINYMCKVMTCLIAGILIVKTTSLHDGIVAMRKCHISQKIIIPISVTIRYFPAIIEEIHYLCDAMKLRKVSFSDRLECFMVSMMMSATSTIEELSAAAVTRGIENPAPKTSIVNLKFNLLDYLSIFIGCIFLVRTFMY